MLFNKDSIVGRNFCSGELISFREPVFEAQTQVYLNKIGLYDLE
jgi:hypothetical protein